MAQQQHNTVPASLTMGELKALAYAQAEATANAEFDGGLCARRSVAQRFGRTSYNPVKKISKEESA
jgi:hypothetical protein